MMYITQHNKPTPHDRLGLTLSIALLVHFLIVFGVSFTREDRPSIRFNTMDIILVKQETKADNESEILAQANLEGGGEFEEVEKPATSIAPSFSDANQQVIDKPTLKEELLQPHDIEMSKTEIPEILDVNEQSMQVITKQEEKNEVADIISENQELDFVYEKFDEPNIEKKIKKRVTTPPTIPSADELLTNSFEIASSDNEVRREMIEKTERLRRKYISANTKQYEYASYMDSWRRKVERVGNLNYPEEARKLNLSGSLQLEVALNRDGTINEITLRKSSGKKVLDDAAIKIVELAAPYAAFPENIENKVDILHILRTWQFINNRSFK